jgi:hypothetical protein
MADIGVLLAEAVLFGGLATLLMVAAFLSGAWADQRRIREILERMEREREARG